MVPRSTDAAPGDHRGGGRRAGSVRAMTDGGEDGLVVVGAGFGRTGTMSMKAALERLGFGPCHHMVEAFARPDDFDQWAAAVRGEPWDAARALDGYRATLDFPSCVVWRELWEANPGSKVLLTTRSSESWWTSFDATIGPEMRGFTPEPGMEGVRRLFDALDEVVFGGRSDQRDAAVAAFEAHNRSVVETVPPDQLLVHSVGDGWGPLCEFLGVEVPDEPFPSSNSTAEFHARKEPEDDAGAGVGPGAGAGGS